MTTKYDMADYMIKVIVKDFDEVDHSVPLKPDHKYVKEYYAFLQHMMECEFYTVWDLFRYGRLAARDSDWLLSQESMKDITDQIDREEREFPSAID
jgi:hypothetical protein